MMGKYDITEPTPPLSFSADDIVETVREPLLVLSAGLRVRRANRSFCRSYHVTAEQMLGRLVYLELAEAFRPDLIVLDIGRPKLNGFDACRRIREKPWAKDTHIGAATGWGQDEDKRRSEEAGFDRHLVKPVDAAELNRLLAERKS